jgi:hypothetical protein
MNHWSVPVHHAASHRERPTPVRRACATREEIAPMLPTNTTPLNERLIRALIEEHQAEIRRCYALKSRGRRAISGWRLLRLLIRGRRMSQPPACQGTVMRAQERA